MAEKTEKDFGFVVKAYRGITHDLFDDRLKNKKPKRHTCFLITALTGSR